MVSFWEAGIGITAAKAQLLLQQRALEKGFGPLNTQQLPAPERLRTLIRNVRQKGTKGLTDCEALWELLRNPLAAPKIVYPINPSEFPHPGKEWFIVFGCPTSLKDLEVHGSYIVGLDGCFKLTKYRYGVLVVSVLDSLGMASPGVIIILSDFTSKLIESALAKVKELLPNWDPDWMIDKDIVELTAIESLKAKGIFTGKVFTCEWHNTRTWQKEIRNRIRGENCNSKRERAMELIRIVQRSKTRKELEENTARCLKELEEELKVPELASYLDFNWFCKRWLSTWIDLDRPNRRGLFNTDNASEALFKIITYLFFGVKVLLSMHIVAHKIVFTVFPYYETQRIQKEAGLITRRLKPRDKDDLIILQKGLALLEKGCVLKIDDLSAEIASGSNEDVVWVSDLKHFRCSCPHYMQTGNCCKHQVCHLMAHIIDETGKGPQAVGLVGGIFYVDGEIFGPKPIFSSNPTPNTDQLALAFPSTPPTEVPAGAIVPVSTEQAYESAIVQLKDAHIQDLEAELADLRIRRKYHAEPPASIGEKAPPGRPKSTLPPAPRTQFPAKKKPGSGRQNPLTGEKKISKKNEKLPPSSRSNKKAKQNKGTAKQTKDSEEIDPSQQPEGSTRKRKAYAELIPTNIILSTVPRKKVGHPRTRKPSSNPTAAPTATPTATPTAAPTAAPTPTNNLLDDANINSIPLTRRQRAIVSRTPPAHDKKKSLNKEFIELQLGYANKKELPPAPSPINTRTVQTTPSIPPPPPLDWPILSPLAPTPTTPDTLPYESEPQLQFGSYLQAVLDAAAVPPPSPPPPTSPQNDPEEVNLYFLKNVLILIL